MNMNHFFKLNAALLMSILLSFLSSDFLFAVELFGSEIKFELIELNTVQTYIESTC